MKKLLLLSTAVAFVPTAAFAQSTGTQETERDTIVVLIPQRMSKADEQTFVKDMVERVLAREARASAPRGD